MIRMLSLKMDFCKRFMEKPGDVADKMGFLGTPFAFLYVMIIENLDLTKNCFEFFVL
jgi:hypothetical protein